MESGSEIVRLNPASMQGGIKSSVALPDGKLKVKLGSGIITSLLGEGGMANVYEVWNPQLEVYHAVKLIKPTSSKDSLERFQTEIKITAKLHHPNISEIYAVGEWNGLPFIEMEKIDGITLNKLLHDRGALPISVCVAIGIMVCRALRYAHNQEYIIYGKTYQGIIHRDLKPENIMVCRDGTVKLMDFGIARPTDASFHTMEGYVVGTLQYLSPEQLNGESLDVRTDVYSFGTTIYEAITGVQAFPEKNIHKLVKDKSSNRYRSLRDYKIQVPARLRKLVQKCMEYNKAIRMSSADALLSELDKIHTTVNTESPEEVVRRFLGTESAKKVVLSTRRRIRFDRAAFAGIVVVAVVLGFAYLPRYLLEREKKVSEKVIYMPVKTEKKPSPEETKPVEEELIPKVEVSPIKKRMLSPPAASSKPAAVQKRLPEKKDKPIIGKKATIMEEMYEKYGTEDLMEILSKEIGARNFQNALKIYDRLSKEQAFSKAALIMKLRALIGTGNGAAVSEFLSRNSINESEFFLAKAKLAYQRKEIAQAQQYLDQSLKAPRELMDYERLKQEVCYYRALCATRLFDMSPSEKTWNDASGAWYQLKNEMRAKRSHAYYKKAEDELRRISEKFHNTEG